ncbi:TKL/SHK protein kinase [Phytophthora cinnamomi]|uniref:TKL/SHK protein kinase n=1 Tax=Phytophthora cinnamomi TaxID=4785 RepID=UPI00355A79E8|nr:TKL/SHK protein kinase [Phytophthora cinnamomi]
MDAVMLRVRLLLGAMALGYGIIFVLCAWLVVYMRHHRSGALRGDTRAARRVLLPAFQPLLWLLTAVSLLYTVCFTLLVVIVPSVGGSGRVVSESFYSGRLFVIALPLGRGFETGERGQKRRFRRNKKWFAIMEESISTGKLRSHESHPSLAETDEFEDYATSGNWEDMESGATTRLNVSDVDEDVELDLESSANVDFESGWGSARSSVVII